MNDIVSFESINGKKILNLLSEPGVQKERKIVIMSHGFRGSSVGPARAFVDFSRILNNNGYSSLRFDQPSSGNSEGEFLYSSFNEWVQTTTYFGKMFLDKGYKVALLGQSMGATTSIYSSTNTDLLGKVPALILWTPGIADIAKYQIESNRIYEEGGQKYYGKFWNEERTRNIFSSIEKYRGAVHLTFGEEDRYTEQHLREKLITLIKNKGGKVDILKGEDHGPWQYDTAQKLYTDELEFLEANL